MQQAGGEIMKLHEPEFETVTTDHLKELIELIPDLQDEEVQRNAWK